MEEPTRPFSLWINASICYIDKDGHKKAIEPSQNIESYSAVKNSVYPHSGQEKAVKSLP